MSRRSAMSMITRRIPPIGTLSYWLFIAGQFVALTALTVCHAAADTQETKPKLPAKEDVTLVTEDDVVLKASYWPSTRGKDAVPVILLHAFNGSRQDFHNLADFLQ